jgi:hypothetical protein
LKVMPIVIFIEFNFALIIYKDFGEIICMWSMCLILKESIVMLVVWEVKSWNTDNIEIWIFCSLGWLFTYRLELECMMLHHIVCVTVILGCWQSKGRCFI